MKLLQSKSGIVKPEAQWRKEDNDFWSGIENDSKGEYKRPIDWWQRNIKVLGLKPISLEEAGWHGIF